MADTISSILSDTQLVALIDGYRTGKDFIDSALRDTLQIKYQRSGAYVNAIVETFYEPERLDAQRGPRTELSPRDRERCIIALLAARGGGFNLALHIYLGIVLGISPAEIANILLLVGTYAGVCTFSEAIAVEERTLNALKEVLTDAPDGRPQAVFAALRAEFPT